MLPRPDDFGRVLCGVLEDVDEDRSVLLEDDRADGKVSLETVDLGAEWAGQVGHVGPLLGLVEELDEAEFAAAEQSGQGDAVALDDGFSSHGGHHAVVTGHVQGAGQPVQLMALVLEAIKFNMAHMLNIKTSASICSKSAYLAKSNRTKGPIFGKYLFIRTRNPPTPSMQIKLTILSF